MSSKRSKGTVKKVVESKKLSKVTTNKSHIKDGLIKNISIGTLVNGNHNISKDFKIDINSLKKHALVCGVTGSGKTNTCFNLMEQLWQHNIPFLVIDTAKAEYRQLALESKILKKSTSIYSIGNEITSPFRMNPFEIMKGVKVSAHIEALKSIFDASFEMWAPMPQVLSKAIDLIYTARGWDLIQNKNLRLPPGINPGDSNCPPNIYPKMKDLYEVIGPLTDSFEYSERIGPDIKAALHARIGGLLTGAKGQVLSSKNSIPLEPLYNQPVIIELKDIFSDNEKTFFASVLLLFLSEYRKVEGLNQSLKHVLFLEDAHRLLKHKNGAEHAANVRQNFVEFFANVFSEMRSYGEGVVISAQSPGQLAPEILSNSNLKIIHRLLTTDDLNSISGSTYLNESHRNKIVTLTEGEAILYTENMQEPSHLQVTGVSKELKSSQNTEESDAIVQQAMAKINTSKKIGLHLGCDFCSDPAVLNVATIVADDPLFRQKYNSYVLATMEDPTQLARFRPQIVHEVQRVIGRKEKSISIVSVTWCALCQATERYFERKGEENYWDYNQVKEQQLKWLELLKLAYLPSNKTHKLDAEAIKKWKQEFVEIQRRDIGPLVGCNACTSKCLYRFEVAEWVCDPKVKSDFNASINRTGTGSDNAAWFCSLLSQRIIGDGTHNVDLAYCLAVHLIKEQQLSNDAQLVLLYKTRTALEKMQKEKTEAQFKTSAETQDNKQA